jgi:hypothetical protein
VPSPNASAAPHTDRLTLDLQRVEGKRVSGSRVRKSRLLPAAETVRRVMTEMYSTGFVDPGGWQGGRRMVIDLGPLTIRTRSRVRRSDELTIADRSSGRGRRERRRSAFGSWWAAVRSSRSPP